MRGILANLASTGRIAVGRFVAESASLAAAVRTTAAFPWTGKPHKIRDAKARDQAVVAALRIRGMPGSIRLGPESSSKITTLRPGQVGITANG